jgi:hypothetical protein
MSSLLILGDTSGSVLLQAPAIAGSGTLTLPTTGGTLISTAAPQSGSVLQVVHTSKTNTDTSSSGSYIDIGLDATITPRSTSSRILIRTSIAIASNTASANIYMRIRNTTAGTTVSNDPYYIVRWPADSQAPYYCQRINFEEIHSPSTTSATTYKIQMYTNAGAFQVNMASNTGGGVTGLVSTVTLMEIAG